MSINSEAVITFAHFCLKGLLKEVGCKSEKAIHLVRSVISSMAHLSQSV